MPQFCGETPAVVVNYFSAPQAVQSPMPALVSNVIDHPLNQFAAGQVVANQAGLAGLQAALWAF